MRENHAFCVNLTHTDPALIYISFANPLLSHHNRPARIVLKEYKYELDHFRLFTVPNEPKHTRKSPDTSSRLQVPTKRRSVASQRGKAATELREAFGVRGACSRCRNSRVLESGSKLHALQTLRDNACAKNLRGLRHISTVGAQPASALAFSAVLTGCGILHRNGPAISSPRFTQHGFTAQRRSGGGSCIAIPARLTPVPRTELRGQAHG